jgi:hypothetical protein
MTIHMNGKCLATRQSGFTDEQLLKMYICGLKDYICSEIKLWNPKTVEDARHATKLIEQKNKFNRPSFTGPEGSNKYSNERSNKYSTDKSNKYVPSPLREDENRHQDPDKKWVNKCRYCEDKWSPGHRCNDKKLYTCEVERRNQTHPTVNQRERKRRKTIVVSVEKIGHQGIDVKTCHYATVE